MPNMPTTLHSTYTNTMRVPSPFHSPDTLQISKILISRHTFCESCITQSLQSSSLCPIDRLPISADEIKPAPKLVASLVNELMVLCPRGCKAEVERGSLVGHLNGRCELEAIVCECGEKCTRGELPEVFEAEKAEGREEEEWSREDRGCIHVYRQCNSCETNIQRLHWKVLPPHTLLFSLFVTSWLIRSDTPSILPESTIPLSTLHNPAPKLNCPSTSPNMSLFPPLMSARPPRLHLPHHPPLFPPFPPRHLSLHAPLPPPQHSPIPSFQPGKSASPGTRPRNRSSESGLEYPESGPRRSRNPV